MSVPFYRCGFKEVKPQPQLKITKVFDGNVDSFNNLGSYTVAEAGMHIISLEVCRAYQPLNSGNSVTVTANIYKGSSAIGTHTDKVTSNGSNYCKVALAHVTVAVNCNKGEVIYLNKNSCTNPSGGYASDSACACIYRVEVS